MPDRKARRRTRLGPFQPDEAPEMSFEIRSVEGTEAERLELEQARVIREVVEWLAQRRSVNGQDNAA